MSKIRTKKNPFRISLLFENAAQCMQCILTAICVLSCCCGGAFGLSMELFGLIMELGLKTELGLRRLELESAPGLGTSLDFSVSRAFFCSRLILHWFSGMTPAGNVCNYDGIG